MAKPQLVLASSSSSRRGLLQRLGVPFDIEAPIGVDEEAVQRAISDPVDLVRTLAIAKAQEVAARFPDAFVIGSDQVAVAPTGEILGKPGTSERAVAQLKSLRGTVHKTHTAVCVCAPGGEQRIHVDTHVLHVRALTDAQIAAYVEREQPLCCAGSYQLENLGVALFERIEGDDSTAVVGLPLMATVRMLAELHFDVFLES